MGQYYDWDELFELDRKMQEEEERQLLNGCLKLALSAVAVLAIVIGLVVYALI